MSIIISLQNRCLYYRYTTTPFQVLKGQAREKITKFSHRSGSRMRRYLRTCCADYSFIGTLTYPADFPTDGEIVKRDLQAFIKRFRRAIYGHYRFDDYRNWSFFWFLEFQTRGAPHFHFFTTHVPLPNRSISSQREWMADNWFECVGSGDEKHRQAGTQFDSINYGRGATISYASKYAAKAAQKDVPENFENVGRFWGVCGLRSTLSATIVISDAALMDKEVSTELKLFKHTVVSRENGGVTVMRDRHGEFRGLYCKDDQAWRDTMYRLKRTISHIKIIQTRKGMEYMCNYDDPPCDLEFDGLY